MSTKPDNNYRHVLTMMVIIGILIVLVVIVSIIAVK